MYWKILGELSPQAMSSVIYLTLKMLRDKLNIFIFCCRL